MNLRVKQADNFREFTKDEYYTLNRENSNTFAIPCEEVPYLYQKLESYGNKADKLNIPYSIVEVGMVTLEKPYKETKEEVECLILSVNFNIKVNGWQFIASIDHLENGNIIKSAVNNITLPVEYRTAKYTTCDHCNTERYRKQTHIVYNETTKEFKQVGSTCLKSYTGIDVNNVVAFADFFNTIYTYNDSNEGMQDFGGFFNGEKYLNVRKEICLAYDLVNIYGYEKVGGRMSTASRVAEMQDYFDGYLRRYQPKRYRALKETFEEKGITFYSDESYKKADEIIKYVLSQKVTNDYMNNMHVLLKNKSVDRKYRNFIVSAIAVYNKGLEREKEYQQKHANDMTSKHVGNVGERLNVTIKSCNTVTSWETEYGVTYIYKFVDVNGNIYTWKTTKVVRDDVTSVTGTVKTHNDYKGIKQTELTRCKVA